MVEADRGMIFGELADAIDALDNPPALTIDQLIAVAPGLEWLQDKEKRRITSHRLMDGGYISVGNPTSKQGLWVIDKRRQAIFARLELTMQERTDAATALHAELSAKKE
jgi:hypothetical protein